MRVIGYHQADAAHADWYRLTRDVENLTSRGEEVIADELAEGRHEQVNFYIMVINFVQNNSPSIVLEIPTQRSSVRRLGSISAESFEFFATQNT